LSPTAPLLPGELLKQGVTGRHEPVHDHGGFGGLHGGLTLGLLTEAMAREAGSGELLSVTGRYHRPIRSEFGITTNVSRSGRTTAALTARAESDAGLHVEASAMFGLRPEVEWPPLTGPAAPDVPAPEKCDETYLPPPDLVPIGKHYEIRPLGHTRPVSGGVDPVLLGWIRLTEDDEPPDRDRLVFIMDMMPPSSSVLMTDPIPVPTVEFSVRPTGVTPPEPSPWVLIRAETRQIGTGGWLDEHIDAWSPDGTHIASAQQLRVLRALA
jgi:hypothetical protein